MKTAQQRLMVIVQAVLWALLLLSGLAHALVPTSEALRWRGNGGGAYYETADAACVALKPWVDANYSGTKVYQPGNNGSTANSRGCFWTVTGGFENGLRSLGTAVATMATVCPSNSTSVTGGCQCNAGFKEQGNQCVPDTNPCTAKAGTTGEQRWTTGWTRTPDDNDFNWVGGPPNYPNHDSKSCADGCQVEVDGTRSLGAYISQSPTSQGLYRNSGAYQSKYTGQQCTMTATDPLNQNAPSLPCPGYVGDVNGVPGCYGTAATPVHTVKVPRTQTPVAGNPPAGPRPTSGEGSGTGSTGVTPSTGDGGNAGGPASAGVGGRGGGAGGAAEKPGIGGGTGGGTGDGTEPPEPCGAPGQPICNVKVDESGMPALDGTFGTLNDEVSKLNEHALIKGGIDAIVARGDLAPQWSWSFALPTGCAPYVMQAFNLSINVCQWQPIIHDLMSMVWLGATIWFLIGLFLKSET